jgi:hypothetical protein
MKMAPKRLTKPQYRALRIIALEGPIRPSRFALNMWPDSPAWKRSYKCGPSGATRGRGIVLSGGSYLGKLRIRGWIRRDFIFYGHKHYFDRGYVLTPVGRDIYENAYHARRKKESSNG